MFSFKHLLTFVLVSLSPVAAGIDKQQTERLTLSCDAFNTRLYKVLAAATPFQPARDAFIASIAQRSETGILTLKTNPEPALPGGRYLMAQNIWGDLLQTRALPRLIAHFDDLRYSPFFTEGSELVIYIDDVTPISLGKVERLLKVAHAYSLKMHTVWLGASNDNSENYRLARILAIASGAHLVELERNTACLAGI